MLPKIATMERRWAQRPSVIGAMGRYVNPPPACRVKCTPYGCLASTRAPDGAYMRSWLSRDIRGVFANGGHRSRVLCAVKPLAALAVRQRRRALRRTEPARQSREIAFRWLAFAPVWFDCGRGLSRFQGSPVSWVQALAAQTYIRSGIDPFQGPSCCCEGKQGSKGGLDHSPSRRLSAMRRTGHTSHLGISISAAVGLPVDYCPQPLRTAPCGIMPVSR